MIRLRRSWESLPSSFCTMTLPTPLAAIVAVDGKVENVQTVLVQFVNHEAHDFTIAFGNHADAVSLSQAANEVVFGPRELETISLSMPRTSGISRLSIHLMQMVGLFLDCHFLCSFFIGLLAISRLYPMNRLQILQ